MTTTRIDITVSDQRLAADQPNRARLAAARRFEHADRVPVLANENQWYVLDQRGVPAGQYVASPRENLLQQLLNCKWRLENLRDDLQINELNGFGFPADPKKMADAWSGRVVMSGGPSPCSSRPARSTRSKANAAGTSECDGGGSRPVRVAVAWSEPRCPHRGSAVCGAVRSTRRGRRGPRCGQRGSDCGASLATDHALRVDVVPHALSIPLIPYPFDAAAGRPPACPVGQRPACVEAL